MTGVGLTLAYALQLWVIHWLAAGDLCAAVVSAPSPMLHPGLRGERATRSSGSRSAAPFSRSFFDNEDQRR